MVSPSGLGNLNYTKLKIAFFRRNLIPTKPQIKRNTKLMNEYKTRTCAISTRNNINKSSKNTFFIFIMSFYM